MYLQVLLGTSFFFCTIAEPIAVPSPAPISPVFSPALRFAQLDYEFHVRYNTDELSACWSTNAICYEYGNVHDSCDEQFESVSDPWMQCICETGAVATEEACDWCSRYYGESELGADFWSSQCSSDGFTIAPVPTSVLSVGSKFNATNTAILAINTGDNGAAPTTMVESISKTKTSRISSPTATETDPGFGSVFGSSSTSHVSITRHTSTTTMFGGDSGAPLTSNQDISVVPTVTVTAGAGSGGGGNSASGLDVRAAAFVSGIMVAMTMVGFVVFQF